MPTLVETKKDGHYIVRHLYGQHATWQVNTEGVLFLRRRGVSLGDKFSTDLFMELWKWGMVYVGTRPPKRASQRVPRSLLPDDRALYDRAHAFYQALYSRNPSAAYTFLLPQIRAPITLAQFEEKLGGQGWRLAPWRISDCLSVPAQSKDWPEARRKGVVFMDLGGARKEFYWVQLQDVWYLCGAGDENAAT
jgi:hypothetical protein